MRSSAAGVLALTLLVGACDNEGGNAGTNSHVSEVNGTTVFYRSSLERIPQQATTVRFDVMLIDSGDGLELCLGGVDESLPPQCSGPVVDSLKPSRWAETQSGVTWGERRVTTTWPPVDGHVQLVADSDYRTPIGFAEAEQGIDGYTPAELEAAQAAVLSADLLGSQGPVLVIGYGKSLSVTVPVADLDTIDQISAVLEEPEILQIYAVGEVIDGG